MPVDIELEEFTIVGVIIDIDHLHRFVQSIQAVRIAIVANRKVVLVVDDGGLAASALVRHCAGPPERADVVRRFFAYELRVLPERC